MDSQGRAPSALQKTRMLEHPCSEHEGSKIEIHAAAPGSSRPSYEEWAKVQPLLPLQSQAGQRARAHGPFPSRYRESKTKTEVMEGLLSFLRIFATVLVDKT